METFTDRFVRTVFVRKSHLCVGLDPDEASLTDDILAHVANHHSAQRIPRDPDSIRNLGRVSAAKLMICQSVLMATAKYAAVYKPNVAFFEGNLSDMAVLEKMAETISGLAPDALRLCDAKRGDIGNTSRLYAKAIFQEWGFDAVTVNPLMGWDSVEPFLTNPAKGTFLLCLTSNPGADDFLLKDDLYLKIARKAALWGRGGNVGLVVGATRPELAAQVRAEAPDLPLLIPGVGAQGGDLRATLEAIDARRNPRFIINASRSIMFPSREALEQHQGDYAGAVAAAAKGLRDAIESGLST